MIPVRIVCYLATMNLFIALLGLVKTESYWYIPPMVFCIGVTLVCSVISYRREKKDKLDIRVNREKGGHYCNVVSSNVVCFERNNELWVKEYCDGLVKEGRTYMVYHCPWCGFQTELSKHHEKANMNATRWEKMKGFMRG